MIIAHLLCPHHVVIHDGTRMSCAACGASLAGPTARARAAVVLTRHRAHAPAGGAPGRRHLR